MENNQPDAFDGRRLTDDEVKALPPFAYPALKPDPEMDKLVEAAERRAYEAVSAFSPEVDALCARWNPDHRPVQPQVDAVMVRMQRRRTYAAALAGVDPNQPNAARGAYTRLMVHNAVGALERSTVTDPDVAEALRLLDALQAFLHTTRNDPPTPATPNQTPNA